MSGGTTERPALHRLRDDVRNGRVRAVAVARLDRLSRETSDFIKLLEEFRQHGVDVICPTERVDMSTAADRLVLRVKADVNQYQREDAAERIRDKTRAARRKGLWTGGRPVLGYDVVDKQLVLNKDEAERVREIFGLYLTLGSLGAVLKEACRRGWSNKTWVNRKGQRVLGRPFSKTGIRTLLSNPLYLGKMRLGDELYEGRHEAIVDQETWDAVQQQLQDHGCDSRRGRRPWTSLLGGLQHCGVCHAAMGHHYSDKKDRRYRYYVCQTLQKQGRDACPGSRVSAQDIESFVVDKIRAIGRDPDLVAETVRAAKEALTSRAPELESEIRQLDQELGRLRREQNRLVDAVAAGEPGEAALRQRLGEIEQAVETATQDRAAARAELDGLRGQVLDEQDLRAAIASFDPVWDTLFVKERCRILHLLLERVTYNAAEQEVALTFRPHGVRSLAVKTREAQEGGS